MKIVIEVKDKNYVSKEGLTINEIDEVVDELQDVLPSDIISVLDGSVLVRKCEYNNIVIRRNMG